MFSSYFLLSKVIGAWEPGLWILKVFILEGIGHLDERGRGETKKLTNIAIYRLFDRMQGLVSRIGGSIHRSFMFWLAMVISRGHAVFDLCDSAPFKPFPKSSSRK